MDRNPAAVSAALTALDACALLERARTRVPGLPAGAKFDFLRDPHECSLSYGSSKDRASLGLGAGLAPIGRYRAQPLTVAGAKAYFSHSGVEYQGSERCWLAIPVSFRDVIDIDVEIPSASAKPQVKACRDRAIAFAVPVMTGLASPGAFPNRRPGARWDACVLLAQALGEPLWHPDFGHRGSVDWCERKRGGQTSGLWYRYSDPKLQVPDRRRHRIAGKVVAEEWKSRIGCTMSWSHGRSGLPEPAGWLMVEVSSNESCTAATTLAPAVMRVLAKPAPAAVSSQPLLTYRPDEPDAPAAGACVDQWLPRSCEPYRPVPAPMSAEEVLRQAQQNPNVNCAIAIAAVRKHLGAGFRPVTDLRPDDRNGPFSCAFVEPTHGLTVWVRVAGHRPKNNREWVTFIGLRAQERRRWVTDEYERSHQHDEFVVNLTSHAQLLVEFEFGEPRSVFHDPPLDTSRKVLLRPLTTDIITAHLR